MIKVFRNFVFLVTVLTFMTVLALGCAKQVESSSNESSQQPEVSMEATVDENAEKAEISMDDYAMVNEYIRSVGANEIPVIALDGITNVRFKNTVTNEIKNNWQLVVDYIRNETSEKKRELDYSIIFEDSCFSLEDNENWKCIGVEEDGEA